MSEENLERREVWVAWTNTDCTEGRGQEVPLAVTGMEATAYRLGKRGSVQGSDCRVSKEVAIRMNGIGAWLVPGRIQGPSREDEKEERRLEAQREAVARKREALERAKAAGLSDEDIEALGGGA